jgi:hypothetical protein
MATNTSSPAPLGPTTNPDFDNRILAYPPTAALDDSAYAPIQLGGGTQRARIARGFMQSAVGPTYTSAGTVATTGYGAPIYSSLGTQYTLNFLYNPSSIDVSYSLDSNAQVIPPYLRSTADTGVALTATGGALSFSLLFDRTYEVNDSSKVGTYAHDIGVGVDAHVLYGLCGITMPLQQTVDLNSSSKSSVAPTSGQTTSVNQAIKLTPNAIAGTMQMLPVWVTFAQIPWSQYGTANGGRMTMPDISLQRYFGYITSIQVSFTHFNQRMVPFRCGMQITVALLSSAGYT